MKIFILFLLDLHKFLIILILLLLKVVILLSISSSYQYSHDIFINEYTVNQHLIVNEIELMTLYFHEHRSKLIGVSSF